MPVLANPRYEKFAQEMAKGSAFVEAYAEAGFKPHRQNAARLMTNDAIQARVAELQERAAEKLDVTISDISRQLDEDRMLAHKSGQAGAAVSATMGKAKLFGLITERHALGGIGGGPIEYKDVGAARDALDRKLDRLSPEAAALGLSGKPN